MTLLETLQRLETAQAYRHGIILSEAGLFGVPLGEKKQPLMSWKERNKGKWAWTGGVRPVETGAWRRAAGTGLACGALAGDFEAPGFLVFDGDNPGGVAAARSLLGKPTLSVRSSPGKMHLYVCIPKGTKVKKQQYTVQGNGTLMNPEVRLDLQADGAYVASPGSKHPKGHRYKIEDAIEPLTLDRPQLDALLAEAEHRFARETARHRCLYRFAALRKSGTPEPGHMRLRLRRLAAARASGLVTEAELRAAADEAGWSFDELLAAEAAVPPKRERVKREKQESTGGGGGAQPWVEVEGDTLEAICDDLAGTPPGSRNTMLFESAMRCRYLGIEEDLASPALTRAGIACGLDEEEIERTLESAWRRRKAAQPHEDVNFHIPVGILAFAHTDGMSEKEQTALWRLHDCDAYGAVYHAKRDGRFLGERRYHCEDPCCLRCAERRVNVGTSAGSALWPERVAVVRGRTRQEVRREAKRLGLEPPVVLDHGQGTALGISPGGTTPRELAMREWFEAWLKPTRDWAALLEQDAASAFREWRSARATRARRRAVSRGTLPSLLGPTEYKAGLLLLGAQPIDTSEPFSVSIVCYRTGEVLAQVDFNPTPLDVQQFIANHRRL